MLRLLRVRDVEEEQRRLALEAALGELHQLESARASAIARECRGRQLLVTSVYAGEVTDRAAALVEVKAAALCAFALMARLAVAANTVMQSRAAYLEKRLERRQVQTILDEAAAKDAIESGRRGQQALDEAFGTRRHREKRNRPHRVEI